MHHIKYIYIVKITLTSTQMASVYYTAPAQGHGPLGFKTLPHA